MNLEYFIARRSERKSKDQEPSIMMRVATIAVALGIIVMIITIAIIVGFKTQINRKLSGLSGHIVVTNTQGVKPSSTHSIRYHDSLREMIQNSGGHRQSGYILRGAIIRSESVIDGVMVKGVDSMFNAPFFEEYLLRGEIPTFADPTSRREALISEELSRDMGVDVGDRLELLFSESRDNLDRMIFKVVGVFSAGVGDIEKRMVITDIHPLRRINGWDEGQISGVELWIDDINKAADIAQDLNEKLIFDPNYEDDNVAALWIGSLYPSLFDWLRTHDVNGVVVVVIMLIVALFNMITALLILVLERTRMIGILKSLGMNNDSLRKIFIYRALSVILRGLTWGNIIAILLCAIQSHFGVIKLDATGYLLTEVPIDLGVWWILALNGGVVVVILLVMTIPTRIVATIKPNEIVKYK